MGRKGGGRGGQPPKSFASEANVALAVLVAVAGISFVYFAGNDPSNAQVNEEVMSEEPDRWRKKPLPSSDESTRTAAEIYQNALQDPHKAYKLCKRKRVLKDQTHMNAPLLNVLGLNLAKAPHEEWVGGKYEIEKVLVCLIEQGLELNKQDNTFPPLVLIAAEKGASALLTALAVHGANMSVSYPMTDIHGRRPSGVTPLHLALQSLGDNTQIWVKGK
jgi:hypothetical protein